MTSTTVTLEVPLNRVEGDLEVRVELEEGRVVDAWSSGTMFRGIENLLVGRPALDSLVITPRVCGICSTAHLTTATRALEEVADATPPADAVRLRNLTLATEFVQSDMRQAFLMYCADLTNPAYSDRPWFDEANRRYRPLAGDVAVEVMRATRRVIEVIAILGGQWPHSSFMVPGGVVTLPGEDDILRCRHTVRQFRRWYEQRVVGCPVERFLAIRDAAGLEDWLEESPHHRESEVGFFLRVARDLGLDRVGRGHGSFLSFGLPAVDSANRGRHGEASPLIPRGFARGTRVEPFHPERITEDVSHAWYEDDGSPHHPFSGSTRPYATGGEDERYSWAKAPRYDGVPAETGPLAERVVARDSLFIDLVEAEGPNALVRELARIARPALVLPEMEAWLDAMRSGDGYYRPVGEIPDGRGFGWTEASRGALGHWVTVSDGKIKAYQIVPPTSWNGSPRDAAGVRGPWEEALVGTEVADPDNPVELGHVVRSFDPCLVCTVHAVRRARPSKQGRHGR